MASKSRCSALNGGNRPAEDEGDDRLFSLVTGITAVRLGPSFDGDGRRGCVLPGLDQCPARSRSRDRRGFAPWRRGYLGGMELLLWILAVVLVVAGVFALFRRQVLWGVVLIIVGLLVGPGGVSVFT
jgi:hypothetical protein